MSDYSLVKTYIKVSFCYDATETLTFKSTGVAKITSIYYFTDYTRCIHNNSGNKHKYIQNNNHYPKINHAIFAMQKKKIIFPLHLSSKYFFSTYKASDIVNE